MGEAQRPTRIRSAEVAKYAGPKSTTGRYSHRPRRASGKLGWNAFQDQGEVSFLLQSAGVVEQTQRIIGFPALHLRNAAQSGNG